MAEGFVGLAFNVSGVFALVDQCLSLYRHIDEARDFGENVWQQYVLFQHECARFYSWQKEMRDFHVLTTVQQPRSPQQRSLSKTMGLPSADEQMHNILAQIVDILETVKTLCEKHKVDQLGQPGQTRPKKADVTSISTGLATTMIGSAVASDGKMAASSITKHQNEAFLKNNTGLFKRVLYDVKLWKGSEKAEFEQLVKDFAHWNNCLGDFLPSTRRVLLDLASCSAILEAEKDPRDLKEIQAAASTGLYESLARRAALRQKNLEQEPEPSSKKDVKCLDEQEIRNTLSLLRGVVTFSNASTAPEPVKCLIEWKSYADLTDYDKIVEAEGQVENLVGLLKFDKKPATMNVLDSLGYFQYEDQDRRLFGFIYAFPPKSDSNQSPVSLHDLLADGAKHKRSYSLPSLSQRISIAQRVAITLLELHSSDWLHKDLNSRNVLFFHGSGTGLDLSKPYVSGFEYARPDDISALSFSVRRSQTDIYRHPTLLGPLSSGQKRPRYQRSHDIYSLGLLLLEVGLWKQVAEFRRPDTTPEGFRKMLIKLANYELPHRVGEIYRDVVLKCIEGKGLYEQHPAQEDELANETQNTSLVKFYWLIIRELERCHCK